MMDNRRFFIKRHDPKPVNGIGPGHHAGERALATERSIELHRQRERERKAAKHK